MKWNSPKHQQENLHMKRSMNCKTSLPHKLQKSFIFITNRVHEMFDKFYNMRLKDDIKIPASSLVKHMGGFTRNTLPCRPPFPTRMPSSSIRTVRDLSLVQQPLVTFSWTFISFGNQKMMVPLSFSNNTAVSAFAGVLSFRLVTSSTPTINPLPRTSPMTGKGTVISETDDFFCERKECTMQGVVCNTSCFD